MSDTTRMDLLRCRNCLRRFLVSDVTATPVWSCPACKDELELMVRSIPGPASRATTALGAQILSPAEP